MRRGALASVLVLVLISGCGEMSVEVKVPAAGFDASVIDAGFVDAGVDQRDAGVDAGVPVSFVLRSVTPLSGSAGTRVTLSVEGLTTAPTAVFFGSAAATQVQLVRPGVLECLSPSGLGVVDVRVEASGGASILRAAFEVLAGGAAPSAGGMAGGGSAGGMAGGGVASMDAGVRQPSFTLEAEAYSTSQGIQLVSPGVGFIDDGDWLAFDAVECGAGVDSVELVLASPNTGGAFEVRLGDPTGRLLGTVQVASTGGWTAFAPQRTRLATVTGQVRLVLVAKGRADVANLDQLRFNP